MTTKTMTQTVVTPRQIEQAKANAQELAGSAWAPQPVKQRDGSTLPLCYRGRMHRALRMLADARNSGNRDLEAQIRGAIEKLNADANAAEAAAEKAIADYSALCALANVPIEDLYPQDCQCVGCQESGTLHRLASAEGNLRRAIWMFLGPARVGELPAIAELTKKAADEKARDAIWRHLKTITDAMQVYEDVCKQTGTDPRWAEVMR